jgi:hypothetical protein
MHNLSVMVAAGALFTLGASADSINVPASPDRYAVDYLASKSVRDLGRGLAVGSVEQFSRNVLVQTGDHDFRVVNSGDFLLSKPVWNPTRRDVTRSTDSFLYSGDRVTLTAALPAPADTIPVSEPATLGLVAVALAAIALMRVKRLA